MEDKVGGRGLGKEGEERRKVRGGRKGGREEGRKEEVCVCILRASELIL